MQWQPWLLTFVLTLLLAAEPLRGDVAKGKRGVIATVHPLATEAGLNAFRAGGNAVDAAIAAALTLGVVDGHNSGIGGGCFMVLHLADGRTIAVDGREKAPAKATREMFIRAGKAQTELSQRGPLAVGTPGAMAAYAHAVEKYGKKPLAELITPAARIAETGFALDRIYAQRLAAKAEEIRKFPETRRILLTPDGKPLKEGEVLKQPDLARTYHAIASRGVEWFYRGPFAESVSEWMKQQGGVLSAEDFASYRVKERKPVVSTYRGHTILGFPPPSSGGVHVAQILNVLEPFDLAKLHQESPAAATHVILEAMKLAFADRAYWLGDPDFAQVPRGLIDKSYGKQLAAQIDPDEVTEVEKQGTPPRAASDFFGRHTTHIAVADDKGNWVAITSSINTSFGSKVIVPGTGVLLNNHMDDFSLQPGVPNAFGLVGAEANAIEPGKRPLSSMSPTIVLKEGQPVMTVGAAGGPKIISQVVLAIVRRIDYKMSLAEVLASPRYHHQWSPDVVQFEEGLADETIRGLKERGHQLQLNAHVGVTQAIVRTADGVFRGTCDPRVPGSAAGF